MEIKNSTVAVASQSKNQTPYPEIAVEEQARFGWPLSTDIDSVGFKPGRKISIDFLVNRLNYVNFQEGQIQVMLAHRQCHQGLFVPAFPQPCSGSELSCLWAIAADEPFLPQTHELKYILVPRGEKFIQSIPEVIDLNPRGCCLKLPGLSREFSRRRVERQPCHGISVHLVQERNAFSGTLLDFSASSFRAELTAGTAKSGDWFDTNQPVNVLFHSGRQTLFSGQCRIIRIIGGRISPSLVLEPIENEARRYQRAEFRSVRQKLCPSPNVIFRHPLTRKHLDLKVVDLSGSGFSVEEEERSASLCPGMVLPDAELHFAGIFKMTCTVQVVFRRVLDAASPNSRVRCGLALVDVAAKDHVKLLSILHQARDQNSYLCNDLDMEALWDFLFETGFIYPKKYARIAQRKDEIKNTYAKLYSDSPDIARHFVYQDNGRILGHMAMIRFWDNAWLIHHHAARKSVMNRAGLIVLDQIGRFVHDTFRVRGMHMDYLVCYYRPQNRFPRRLFGGLTDHIDDPKGCSQDLFAFVTRSEASEAAPADPQGWQLSQAEATDLDRLAEHYEKLSGGLMLKAFDLDSSNWREEKLCAEFQSNGFRRERQLFALRKNGSPKAILLLNISDIGLNLSDLTHCINAFVLDPDGLPPQVLLASLHRAEAAVGQTRLPALIFPMSYVEKHSIAYEKAYCLWVFQPHTQGQAYSRYLDHLLNKA